MRVDEIVAEAAVEAVLEAVLEAVFEAARCYFRYDPPRSSDSCYILFSLTMYFVSSRQTRPCEPRTCQISQR